MTEEERKQIIHEDRMAQDARDRREFERLRMYYRLNFQDGASDRAFLKWCADMVKASAMDASYITNKDGDT